MQEVWEQRMYWKSALPCILTGNFKDWNAEIKDLENSKISVRYLITFSKLDFKTLQIL